MKRSVPVARSLVIGAALWGCSGAPMDNVSPDLASPPGAADLSGQDAARADAGAASFLYTIEIDDAGGLLTAQHEALRAATRAALDEWARYIQSAGTLRVQLLVARTISGRFGGRSVTNVSIGPCVHQAAPCTLTREQAINRFLTGMANPASPGLPDVEIDVDPNYVQSELWFDPDPVARTAIVPNNRLDAISVIIHELGHAFGFNGFRSRVDGSVQGTFLSTYDDQITLKMGQPLFTGPKTVVMFGGPLPLTISSPTQNIYHYGNAATPSPINKALMNGIVYEYGRRYPIAPFDVAVLEDSGVPIREYPQ